jgi:hypothetical protein
VPTAKVEELMAYLNDTVKYNVLTKARAGVMRNLLAKVMQELEEDYALHTAGPVTMGPVAVRVGEDSGAAVIYQVYSDSRTLDHNRAQTKETAADAEASGDNAAAEAAYAGGAEMGSPAGKGGKRSRPADNSVSPPVKSAAAAGKKGATSVTNLQFHKAASKADKLEVSKDGKKLSVVRHIYDLELYKADVNKRATTARRRDALKLAGVYMLNDGKATAQQRLVYAPAGTTIASVTGPPFPNFKASAYYLPGVKYAAADF